MLGFRSVVLGAFAAVCFTPAPAAAADWHVAVGGSGRGTSAAPFGRIQDAINVARPGDVVHIAKGTYKESIRTIRGGAPGAEIVLRATGGRGAVLVTATGRVLTVRHAHITIEDLVLDGQYGLDDLVLVDSAADGFTLRNSEVRRTSRDAIDIRAPQDVLIEDSLIHHALNATGGRTDAHAIVAGAVRRLTIRNTEMHTFSGDGFQVDPARGSPAGWSDVTIEGCRIWLAPLPAATNGFAAGTVPGENAVDTKANGTAPRATLTIRDTVAYGFRDGLIGNMAAFNLKENVDALLDRVTVYDSEIAFRMRGPGPNGGAWVRVQNGVVYDVSTAFRYEDHIENLRIWNVTVGSGVSRAFQNAVSSRSVLDVRNFLFLGKKLPVEASGPSNLAADVSWFVNASEHDYQLAADAPAIGAGVAIPEVSRDRKGTTRPQGEAYDVGAYEWSAGTGSMIPPAAPQNFRIVRTTSSGLPPAPPADATQSYPGTTAVAQAVLGTPSGRARRSLETAMTAHHEVN